MSSVTQKYQQPMPRKTPSAPHTFVDGVEGKVCGALKFQVRANAAMGCKRWRSLSDYRSNVTGYQDGRDGICAECRNVAAIARDAQKAQMVAPHVDRQTPRDSKEFDRTELVVVRGIGVVKVGWEGESAYWPVKPLKRLMNMAWTHVRVAIKSDPILAPVGTLFVSTGIDDKRYEMLCLPWSHWHSFWLKFGNAETIEVQQDAQRVLARAFGHTAEQVQQQTQRARGGSIPLLDLDTYRKHRERFKALDDADNQIARARLDAVASLTRAQELRLEADRLVAEAQERQRIAKQAEQDAQHQIDEASRQQASIEAEINKLLGQDAEWVYDFGRESDITPMYVSGKFGDTANPTQRRKQLRQGDTRHDFRIKRPCDNAKGVADQIERYFRTFGTIRGNDGYENVPRARYDRLLSVMQAHEYIEVESFARWVDAETRT